MARPPKDGLDYFPLDVGFLEDKKVKLIKAEFGAHSIMVLIELFSEIYGENGYFKNWDDDDRLLISDKLACGCSPDLVGEVVQGCLRRSLFDEGVFKLFSVLTSPGIQRRYFSAVAERSNITVIREYFLLDVENPKDISRRVIDKVAFTSVNRQIMSVNRQKTEVNMTINPQSKVKESIEEKSIEINNSSCLSSEDGSKPDWVRRAKESIERTYGDSRHDDKTTA